MQGLLSNFSDSDKPFRAAAHLQDTNTPDPVTERQLSPEQEQVFRQWLQMWSNITGIDYDPDARGPSGKLLYDYRAAYEAGAEPELTPQEPFGAHFPAGSLPHHHWPSQFKGQDHPTLDAGPFQEKDTFVPQELRRLTEPENLTEAGMMVATGFAEPYGSMLDAIDLAAGIEDHDWPRAMFGGLSLLIPAVSIGAMAKVGRGGDGLLLPGTEKIQGTVGEIADQPTPMPLWKDNPTATSVQTKGPGEAVQRYAQDPRVVDELKVISDAGMDEGREWYELGGLRQQMGDFDRGVTFDDWTIMGGPMSRNTPVDIEIMRSSVINFARQNNLSFQEAAAEMQRRYGDDIWSGNIATPDAAQRNMWRDLERGYNSPTDLRGKAQKVTGYSAGKRGQGGVIETPFDWSWQNPSKTLLQERSIVGNLPALDTHMWTVTSHILNKYPELAQAAMRQNLDLNPKNLQKVSPFFASNSLDYIAASDPIHKLAARQGLPTVHAAQATVWEGARNLGITRIDSPQLTYTETLEKVIQEANRLTGKYPDTRAGAMKYWQDVMQGFEMLPVPKGR